MTLPGKGKCLYNPLSWLTASAQFKVPFRSNIWSVISLITVRNEVAKVMFLQVSVCPQEGGCLVSWGAWSQGGTWSGGVPGPGGFGIPACTEADPPRGETATAADGTHPTGMHSCFKLVCIF